MHWTDWLAIALSAFGVVWLLYCVFWDAVRLWFRRRRRCPKCWYDLSGTPGLRCSECGYEAGDERILFRFRVRRQSAVLAVLALIASWFMYRSVEMQARGWPAAIPTTVLIETVPRTQPDEAQVKSIISAGGVAKGQPVPRVERLYSELYFRILSEPLLPIQSRRLARLIHQAGHLASFGTQKDSGLGLFVMTPWMHLRHAASTSASNQVLASYLVGVQGDSRARWPTGVPITMIMRFTGVAGIGGLGGGAERTHGRLLPRGSAEREFEIGIRLDAPPTPAELTIGQGSMFNARASIGAIWDDQQVVIANADREQVGLRYDMHMRRLLTPVTSKGVPTIIDFTYPLEVPMTIEGSISEYLTPVAEPEIEQLLRTGLDQTLQMVDDRPALVLNQWPFDRILFGKANHTIAIEFTIMQNDLEVGRGQAWWWVVDHPGVPSRVSREVYPGGNVIRLEGPIAEWTELPADANLTLRMESDAALALRNFECDRYWEGRVEVPLVVEVE